MATNDDGEYRIEKDSLGEVRVPARRYWGAQTERSRQNFPIGHELIPVEVVRALGLIKKACARANLAAPRDDNPHADRLSALAMKSVAVITRFNALHALLSSVAAHVVLLSRAVSPANHDGGCSMATKKAAKKKPAKKANKVA